MTLWSQGEAREGEAASPEGERWKGEVSSPSKEVREWRVKSDWRESASYCSGSSITVLKMLPLRHYLKLCLDRAKEEKENSIKELWKGGRYGQRID